MMYKLFIAKEEPMVLLMDGDTPALWIPSEPANSDYQKYLAWVAEGNTATEWQPEA